MTDEKFVERLRPIVETWRPIGSGPEIDRLFALARRGAEAAAEIERLRAQVAQLLDIVANWKDTGADAIAVMDRLLEDRNKLLAENEQLRAALYDIEQEALSYNHYGYAEKAQEALNKNEDDEALKEYLSLPPSHWSER